MTRPESATTTYRLPVVSKAIPFAPMRLVGQAASPDTTASLDSSLRAADARSRRGRARTRPREPLRGQRERSTTPPLRVRVRRWLHAYCCCSRTAALLGSGGDGARNAALEPLGRSSLERDVVSKQAGMKAHEATGQKPDLDLLEPLKSPDQVGWPEHPEQRRVSFRRMPKQEPKPALQPVAVRH